MQKKQPKKQQNELTYSGGKSMKVKPTILLLFVITLFAIIITGSAYAGTVRGRLDRQGPYGIYPVSYMAVPAYTGANGMYYLYNIPYGGYALEIWVNGFSYPPITYRISVFNQPYTDIKPILIP
jgi:hypothetical protein